MKMRLFNTFCKNITTQKQQSMIELNKIYNEDCLEGMKRIPDGSVDLVVTSPPYDNLRTYGHLK